MKSKIRYITTRDLKNSKGEVTGKIRVLVLKDSDEAMVSYTCPECGYTEKTTKKWKRPFSVRCSNCGYLIRVPRLKNEIKKELKTNNK
ncbi:MAG: hypothetical protein J7K98_01160 [Candidatus Aenigmarchaeota archaeon]|nr:hypothetical protein [Candidatus Aenigmarchaeota archaeon]